MIALLSGKPIIVDDLLIVDVGGVGYGVYVNAPTLTECQSQEEITLHIYTHVQEDSFELYGFLNSSEKKLFMLLLNVSGVGPKTALMITQRGSDQIVDAVQQADTTFFKSVPRVGKKLAQKIIIDLTSKLGSLKELNLSPLRPDQQTVSDALISLGFDESQSTEVVRSLELEKISIEDAIKQAIQKLGKN